MKYLTFLFACFITILAQSQSWQRLIENPFNFGGAQARGIRIIDDTIFVSSVFVVVDSTSNSRLVISKHDIANGDLLDYKQYFSPDFENATSSGLYAGYDQLFTTNDEYIRLAVNYWDDSQDSINSPSYLMINRNLNVVDSFGISGFEGDYFTTFNGNRIDNDGNLLLYGNRRVDDQMNDPEAAYALLIKMTPQGEQIWKKKYPDSYSIVFLETLSDGDVIFNCGRMSATWVDEKQVIKTNGLGEEQWRLTLGGMLVSPHSAIVETSEGKIILVNSWNYDFVDEPGTGWWYRKWLQLQKIEDLGDSYNIEEDLKYAHTTNVLDAYGIEEMVDSNLLVWGIIQSTAGDTYDTINQLWTKPTERGFLMMLNSELDSLWFRTYYHPDDDWLQMYSEYLISDVAPLENGGFVTCGWGDIRDMGDLHQVWLMRLDEYGCLEPGCQNVNPTEIVVGYENSIQVYPNPVVDVCTLQWNAELASKVQSNFSESQIIIIDAMGREVQRQPVNNFGSQFQLQIDMSSFSPGLYQAHWVSGGSWLDSVQIIKQ